MLTVPEKIAQSAELFCKDDSHGYSQPNRAGDGTKVTYRFSDGTAFRMDGGDIDCSELAKDCANVALSGSTDGPISYMWTGNEDEELLAQGFMRIAFSKAATQRGDILWRSGHTGIALGDGLQAEAAISEHGTISGKKGDQTGYEVRVTSLSSNWTYIYRYKAGTTWLPLAKPLQFTFAQQTNVRTSPDPSRSDNLMSARWKAGQTATFDGIAFSPDGRYQYGTYIGPTTGKRLYAVMADVNYGVPDA